jgi:hypothetical protein
MDKISEVRKIMAAFAQRTGLAGSASPKRYLWTDAFAVCNFLELFVKTGEPRYRDDALKLVAQVHDVLGRHRADDPRSGWISGLDEEQGRAHPTLGGLRIGKPLNERKPGDPYDDMLEWEQDGQYFHYLTKWMHALNRVAQVTGEYKYNRWALELAKTAHVNFTHTLEDSGEKRMYWKMSIDLSRPLVTSMGQHDALDGFITYLQLAATAADDLDAPAGLDLGTEIAEAMRMCEEMQWATDDPLGIGGLLSDACRVAQLIVGGDLPLEGTLVQLLSNAKTGLEAFLSSDPLNAPSGYRLPFRELGLAIGLRAAEKTQRIVKRHAHHFTEPSSLEAQLSNIAQYLDLHERIENYWLKAEHQKSATWREHLDINSVMLATSLEPEGFLLLR